MKYRLRCEICQRRKENDVIVVELHARERNEVEDVVAVLRMGALALGAAPVARTDGVEINRRRRTTDRILHLALSIEEEAQRLHEEREAMFRAANKRARSKI